MKFAEWLRSLFPLPSEPKVESSASVETLLADMRDARPSVRKNAILALAGRCEGRAPGGIIEALDDPDEEVRLAAVVALGKIGDPRAVEPLILKLKGHDYFYVRKKAAYTLYTFLKQEGLDDGLRQKIRSHWRSWYLT
jgi:HEAT repeat protein